MSEEKMSKDEDCTNNTSTKNGYKEGRVAKQKRFLTALEKNSFNVSATCEDTGINRNSYYLWLQKDEKFKNKIEKIRELRFDIAKDSLIHLAEQGYYPAVKHILSKCKDWDDVEKSEVKQEHSGKVSLNVNFKDFSGE